ncbi:hypothetical protein BLNAU_13263 [Blattamonas nauphoetae]|uniref:Uncharacterized protein n=1 Tax=Blattamonas nauphoetae TaxID=2049346 RepID=A0ABQ9XJX6_9EUKA|nr:hypothetical protein BLNAU_13263 [Blattamonas nauphoetae]
MLFLFRISVPGLGAYVVNFPIEATIYFDGMFFLHIRRTLERLYRLILPLNDVREDIVFAQIMVALVEHFVASGDLILQNSSPTDHSQYFAECYRNLDKNNSLFSNPNLPNHIVSLFIRFVLRPDNHSSFVVSDHSFLRGVDAEHSTQLLDVVKKLKGIHSLEILTAACYDWGEWVTMLEMVERSVESVRDLSFLQSPCFRRTLLSLQTKHQLHANTPQIEEKSGTESSSDEISTFITRLPSEIEATWNLMTASSSESSASISTQTALPSSLPSGSRTITSEETRSNATRFTRNHSQRVLLAIHLLLTRPPQTSYPWNIRQSRPSFSDEDAPFQPSPRFVDQNEKFSVSLFDETDDAKLLASLRRCRAVVEATNSTDCIPDIHTFRSHLIAGLHSSNPLNIYECSFLFFILADFLPTADDPRDSQFLSLQKAFRDGSYWEKVTLLNLWGRWFSRDGSRSGKRMKETDFDFNGLLNADLTDTHLFDVACSFVGHLITRNVASMPQSWLLDFLLQFEKRHQMMVRLTGAPSTFSDRKRSRHFLSQLSTSLGSLLSLFCGCDFPSALTEHITTDLSSSPHPLSLQVNPAYFLSHTSIAPNHRHSFFPMDLMFERYLRSDPDAFFRSWPDMSSNSSRKFLLIPLVGLHSLLLRCPKLHLTPQALHHFLRVIFGTGLDAIPEHVYALFDHFPPPRLIDTLLSPPHLVRDTSDMWVRFLAFIDSFLGFVAPFGACSSLAKVFKMLSPFGSHPKQIEISWLRSAGDLIVSLHWLSIPAHFDSPLLCHLPSLAGAQRGLLQTLSSHSGIPSLVTTLATDSFSNDPRVKQRQELSFNDQLTHLSRSVRSLASASFTPSKFRLNVGMIFTRRLLLPSPALVSVAFEFFHRFVSVSSDAVRIELVERGLLDHLVVAVSNSLFLDDYEKGVAVIGILLGSIQRDNQKRRISLVDFSSLF